MLTIDATVAGTTSNSFQTLDEAEAYFATVLPALKPNWTAAGDEEKKTALISACSRLERYRYNGERTTRTQRLKFPRCGIWTLDLDALDERTIPRVMKEAQCELAEYMLGQIAPVSSSLDRFEEIKLPGGLSIKPRFQSGSSDDLPARVSELLNDLLLSGSSLIRA